MNCERRSTTSSVSPTLMQQETFGPLGPQYVDYSSDIKQSGERLRDVISDVLDMSRLEAGRVRLAKDRFRHRRRGQARRRDDRTSRADKDITSPPKPCRERRIHADRDAIEKSSRSFLRNAVKYTPNDGRVSVRARIDPGALNVYVEDTGIGIAAAPLARLGRPFEQLDGASTMA